MKLADCLLNHLSQWESHLPQERSLDRVTDLGIGLLCGVGQRTITRAIGFHGNTHKDWSADYKMFSRSPWEPRELFTPILQEAIGQHQLKRLVEELRQHLNQSGSKDKPLVVAGDGSFCNRTVLACNWQDQGVSLVLRCRKDLVLCKRARSGTKRFYGTHKFTPEQVRRWDGMARWQSTPIFHGGRMRNVRFKEISPVYWQRGGKKQPLRLIVLASTGYRQSKHGRRQYHKPAYLLTTDLKTPAAILIQDYFDRWAIEVNHRDEKEILGVGQAQVWNDKSVCKVPALIVVMYSWLLLSALECYGATRTSAYLPLPAWRQPARRASCQDMVALLRKQLADEPTKFHTAHSPPNTRSMVLTAAA